MASYIHDDAEWAPYEMPVAVVRPRTAEQVQTVVQACIAHGAPVVTRGAGTGLSGGANAVAGGVVIAFDAMNAIKEINTLERLAVVEPGVVNDHLRDACAEHGLWYPPDPASAPWSTIGGNVATNAGGCVASSTASPRTTYWACRWLPEPVSWFGSGVELPREWLGLISPRSWSAPKALSG